MNQPRLVALLLLTVGLIGLRWWSFDAAPAGTPVVQALARNSVPGRTDKPLAPALNFASALDLAAGTRDAEDGPVRNAFALRAPPAPPKPKLQPAPPALPALKPFIGPLLPPPPVAAAPPPPPPLQVIGGWIDERGASVFVAGPRGVMQGRVGDLLLSEYRITQIAPHQVQVTHVPTNRLIPLPVPSGTLPTLTAAR